MKTKFIEAVGIQPGGGFGNHGKFAVSCFDPHEWARQSEVDAEQGEHRSLLMRTGWGAEHFFVTDLQTGEGAMFRVGGYAHADLDKHAIWVCPLFEPFLGWLYERFNEWFQHMTQVVARSSREPYRPVPSEFLRALPTKVDIELPLEFAGYRRLGLVKRLEELEALLHDIAVARRGDTEDVDENWDRLPDEINKMWARFRG